MIDHSYYREALSLFSTQYNCSVPIFPEQMINTIFFSFSLYSKNQTRAKQMSIGRKKFNMDPKKGIEYLVEHGLLQHTQEDVAAFLYKGEGLNKTAIGDYLGERNEFNEKVLKAFVDLHDFTDLILVQALR